MLKSWTAVACGLLLTASLVAGCGGASGDAGGSAAAPGGGQAGKDTKTSVVPIDVIDQPVHLTIAAQLSDDLYAQFIDDPIKKKFPNVTLERLKPGGNANANPKGTAQLISEGTIPDIVYSLPGWYGQQKLQDLFSDMTPLVKKYNFDTSRYFPGIMDTVLSYSPEGKIEFLPDTMTTLVLLYNKDIFDKFGVSYPKDGMTWEESFELAKKLSRTDNGKNYRGMDVLRDFNVNNTQLSLPFVDQKTMKAAVNTDGWKRYLTMLKSMYDIAGNKPEKKGDLGNFGQFYQTQSLAMYVGRLENITTMVADKTAMNWDMATMPTYKELPKTATQVNAPYYAITPASKNRDAAFKVIAYLISDPVQIEGNKDGRLTVLKDEAIRKQFGANIKEYSGKHIEAAIALQAAKPRPYTIYDNFGVIHLATAIQDMVLSGKDINTALREADEATNKDIEANKQ
ncbi:MAG: family 1 extracellular solute-binding protein [Paenibacillaceae bacterium]|jgi:multiple sugar transport system substrate-binding protein|nr:family 1 extracellular solute-binding protein [Paenibacillaceae bacterium]